MLVDPAAEAIGAVAVHVPEGTSVVAAAALLEDVLLRFPGVETVALMVGGRRAALASRSFLTRAFGAPSRTRGPGTVTAPPSPARRPVTWHCGTRAPSRAARVRRTPPTTTTGSARHVRSAGARWSW